MFNGAWLAGGIPRTACVAAYEPICAVSLADSYRNRANPGTYHAAPGVAPTWSESLGWIFNGTNQYLTTGVAPPPYASTIVRFSGGRTSFPTSNASALIGSVRISGGVQRHNINSQGSNSGVEFGVEYGINGDGTSANGYPRVLPALAAGVLALAGTSGYRDGALSVSATAGFSSTGATIGLYIGTLNVDNEPYSLGYFVGNIQAIYIYNVPITPTQIKAVTDAMNMLPMRPKLPRFRSWMTGGALTQFRKAFGLRTGSRGVPE